MPQVRRCFTTLGFDEDGVVTPILRCVAACLHLGNIQFEVVKKAMEEDSSAVANEDVMNTAAALLGIDAAQLKTNLTSKNIGNRSVLLVAYSVDKAQESRDALVKALYGNLFQVRGVPAAGNGSLNLGDERPALLFFSTSKCFPLWPRGP